MRISFHFFLCLAVTGSLTRVQEAFGDNADSGSSQMSQYSQGDFSGNFRFSDQPAAQGFVPLPVVMSDNFKNFILGKGDQEKTISDLCTKIATMYKLLNWQATREGCGQFNVPWQAKFKTQDGRPLIFAELGHGTSTTLILGGVHSDEVTPIPLAFRFANHLQQNQSLIPDGGRVVIAPLVNPDGFFRSKATRTNGHGVDLNRNFFTQDWYAKAKHWWADRRNKSDRHFPGHIPNSEIETLFQIWLIDTFKPDKIISIHAPLGFYDYDGPDSNSPRMLTSSEQKAKTLVHNMSASSRNYKIVDYSYYPGSLGNYAGIERGIPTVTLELETTDPKKINEYWAQFSPGLEQAVKFPFVNQKAPKVRGASLFLESLKM